MAHLTAITHPAIPILANPLYNAGHYVVAGKEAHNGFHYEQALQCIRCSACLNIYPVYREVGGHVYGSP